MSQNSSKKFKLGIYLGIITWFALSIKEENKKAAQLQHQEELNRA
jgi:hypothetical protein